MAGARILLLLMLLLLLLPPTASAQSSVTTQPSQITVAGVRGDQIQRTVLLTVTEPMNRVQIIPQDLERDDKGAVLPSSHIQVAPLPDQIEPGSLVPLQVVINLQQIPSGLFTGNLLISYQAGLLTLPIVVTVKSQALIPFLVLVLGVLVGTAVSAYRVQGHSRDQMLVRIGQLRRQIDSAPELADSFWQRIEAAMLDAETTVQMQQWDEAEVILDRAEAIWIRWRRDQLGWQRQFACVREIETHLQQLDDASTYQLTIARELDNIVQRVPDMQSSEELRQVLDPLTYKTNLGLRLQERFNELKRLRSQLSTPAQRAQLQEELHLQWDLNELQPPADETEADYASLEQRIDAAIRNTIVAIEPATRSTTRNPRVTDQR
ncbi:MAG: hypothetical protein HC837_17020 [Chloroflexaceae bacterium]|nr:hypothetical protein [Chloroflexaceae bacterium]